MGSSTSTGLHRNHDHAGCCAPNAPAGRAVATALLSPIASSAHARPSDTERAATGGPFALKETSARSQASGAPPPADLLVIGRIATGDPARPVVGAMAVSDQRITALGSAEDLEGLRGPDTEVFAPQDGVVAPGLVEPHMHLWMTAAVLDWVDCSQQANPRFDDVVDRLKAAAGAAAADSWICGANFDPSLYPGEPDLTAAILDRVSPDLPVAVLNASMHFLYVNSKAFQKAGVTDETPDPPGGTFYRADGKLTGVVGELGGVGVIAAAMPQQTPDQVATNLRRIMCAAASRGVTSMREALTGQLLGIEEFHVLQQLNAAERFPTRISIAMSCLVGAESLSKAGLTRGTGDDMVRLDAWKVISDGSNQGRSGYMRDRYLGGVGEFGKINYDLDQLAAHIREGHEAGWQVMVHANGDAAIDRTITAFERVLSGGGGNDLRHRIEHCSITHPEQLRRMAAAGLSPSFLMNHVYFWGRTLRDNVIGPERADRLDRVGSAVAAGLRPSLHSDYNVSPIHPLLAARTAVLREMRDGGAVLAPEERVSATVALAAITTNAAWQIHADDRGSLEVGKLADFAVLSDDPWTADPSSWDSITVSETRLGGIVAWKA